jgi:hypothetical protein
MQTFRECRLRVGFGHAVITNQLAASGIVAYPIAAHPFDQLRQSSSHQGARRAGQPLCSGVLNKPYLCLRHLVRLA